MVFLKIKVSFIIKYLELLLCHILDNDNELYYFI